MGWQQLFGLFLQRKKRRKLPKQTRYQWHFTQDWHVVYFFILFLYFFYRRVCISERAHLCLSVRAKMCHVMCVCLRVCARKLVCVCVCVCTYVHVLLVCMCSLSLSAFFLFFTVVIAAAVGSFSQRFVPGAKGWRLEGKWPACSWSTICKEAIVSFR